MHLALICSTHEVQCNVPLNCSIVVEVGVETYSPLTCGHQIHYHGDTWVGVGKEYVKLKASIGIWCIRMTSDECLGVLGLLCSYRSSVKVK